MIIVGNMGRAGGAVIGGNAVVVIFGGRVVDGLVVVDGLIVVVIFGGRTVVVGGGVGSGIKSSQISVVITTASQSSQT